MPGGCESAHSAFLLHVTRREEVDQGADRRDMRQHHRGQAVDVQTQ